MLEETRFYETWRERARLRDITLHQYQLNLAKFDTFLVEEYHLTAEEFSIDEFWVDKASGRTYPMDKELINEFVEWLEDEYEDEHPSMPPACFRAVKSFFVTLKEHGFIRVNPMTGAVPPAFYKSPKGQGLTHSELKNLLDAAFRKDPFSRMYVAMVLLLAGAGLRNRELRYLTVERLDIERRIAIIDQGQKTAPGTVSISSLLLETLHQYLHHPAYTSLAKKTGQTLVFIGNSGSRLRAAELIDIITSLARDAGIQKHVTPHTLRRTFATEMYRHGVDPEVMRQAMRHKSLDTTTGRYVSPDTEEDRQALESFSLVPVLAKLAHEYLGF